MSEGLDKLVGAIGDTLETAPTLYEDALQPTIQEVGKFAARIPRAINAAFSGLDKWILNKEYAIDETKKLLEKKLENIDPDKIVKPNPYIAIPALQAISYSMDSKELRNLYANLLAKAMNSDCKSNVHPAFIEIIKQLSPIDASIFKIIYESKYKPLIDLSIEVSEGAHSYFANNISWITSYDYDSILISINNLMRLGLIEIPYNKAYSDDSIYDTIRNTDFFKGISHSLIASNLGQLYQKPKYINCTDFACSFYKICVSE